MAKSCRAESSCPSWTWLKMETERVAVFPGMAPATRIVAPNSPRARAKARTAPASHSAKGEWKRDGEEDAGGVSAERAGDLFQSRVHLFEGHAGGADEQGKTHDGERDHHRFPGEDDFDPEPLIENAPEGAAFAEQLEKDQAGRDGRKDQWKRDKCFDE